MKKRLIFGLGLIFSLFAIGLAVAQTYPPPYLPTISSTTDCIADVAGGHGQAQTTCVYPAQISNAPQYAKITPTVATSSYNGGYFGNAQTYMIFILTATMPYSYSYSTAAPSDGARECITGSGGAITNANFIANNSTQTVTGGTNVSISSNSSICYTYSASNLTWDRS